MTFDVWKKPVKDITLVVCRVSEEGFADIHYRHDRHLGLTSSANETVFCFYSLSVLSHVFGAVDKTSSLVFQRMVK